MIREVETIYPHRIEEAIARINKKAIKKSLPAVQILEKKSRVVKSQDDIGFPIIYQITTFRFEIPEETNHIKQKGVEFTAAIERTASDDNLIFYAENGNTSDEIRNLYGKGNIPCDHCRKNLYRIKGFVFRKDDKHICIGSSCVDEYFGINVEQLLEHKASAIKLFESFGGVSNEYKEMVRQSRSDMDYWFKFYCMTMATIELKGYKSKAKAEEEMVESTSGLVTSWLSDLESPFPERRDYVPEDIRSEFEKKKGDFDSYKAFVEWYSQIDDDAPDFDEFKANMKIIVVSYDRMKPGLMAYSIWNYYYETVVKPAKEAEKKNRKPSEHIGNIKERIEIDVIYSHTIPHEGTYGTTWISTMWTPEGNRLTWFGSRPLEVGPLEDGSYHPVEKGEKIRIKATIKNHDEYNGEKITVVSRVKELNLIEE